MILTNPLFWQALKDSGSVDESRGMKLIEFKASDSSLITFSKNHSYGEYIFDWAWADAYQRSGIPYYPKLTSMVPFTPATTPHFWGPTSDWDKLLKLHDEILNHHSSAHFLFTTKEEQRFLVENNYIPRLSFQYHFFNEGYSSFDEFLGKLKNKKAKNIREERKFNLKIQRITGSELTTSHAHEMYDFYLMTLKEKRAIPYLTREFFENIVRHLPHNILYVRAQDTAGALFYYDENTLYGRYWGAKEYIPNLHFELCYYQGIEFAIEKKISVFEAGAQGEHKIARGFRPTLITSAHKINHPGFSRAISEYVRDESIEVKTITEELMELLPYSKN